MGHKSVPPLPFPDAIRRKHLHWQISVAWSYIEGKTVYRMNGPGGGTRFLKLTVSALLPRLKDEALRLQWASNFVKVPSVLDEGVADGVDWLLLEGLRGQH